MSWRYCSWLRRPWGRSRPTIRSLCVDGSGGPTDEPCTNATAYTTLDDAIFASHPGDELRIATGSYGSALFTNPLTIQGGYPGVLGGWTTPSS